VTFAARVGGACGQDRDGDQVAGAIASDHLPAELDPAALNEAALPGVLGGTEGVDRLERLAVVGGGSVMSRLICRERRAPRNP